MFVDRNRNKNECWVLEIDWSSIQCDIYLHDLR
jgi:hypothetical protein